VFNPIALPAGNPGPMTGAGNNTYLVVQRGGSAVLIDAGVGRSSHLDAIATKLAAGHAELDRVLVTHHHADHASGAHALADAHRGARFMKFPWPTEDVRYAVTWISLADGERIEAGGETLIALHTPGHSPDHLAFLHEATATIFTGDLLVAGSSVTIPASRGGHLGQYLQSLERVLSMSPARLLPAHGPAIERPAGLIREYMAHRRLREEQVLAALGEGRETVQSIAERIYHGLESALMPAARENVRAHLEQLQREGRAVEQAGRWTR
jgi:glyoxylase-like metal-dependent hydrolase (beta-lactamase superfamily II)